MNSIKIEAIDNSTVGTNCQICDAFILLVGARYDYPRICNECKKRLKKLLYPEENNNDR